MAETKLANNMRYLREINGYSQQYVSGQIHVARQTYSIYETGKRVPDLTILCNLAKLYNISLDYLVYTDLAEGSLSGNMLREHGAIGPDDSLIRLNGTDTRMLVDYKDFPADAQREVREFVRFKKYLLSKDGKNR